MMYQGITLLLFGMGTVFVFLSALVFSTTLMSYVVNRYCPEEDKPLPSSEPPASLIDDRLLSAISQALKRHRAQRK